MQQKESGLFVTSVLEGERNREYRGRDDQKRTHDFYRKRRCGYTPRVHIASEPVRAGTFRRRMALCVDLQMCHSDSVPNL